MVEFGTLHADGRYEHKATVRQSDIQRCPHAVLVAEHYRSDGSCRCSDRAHRDMMIAEWFYSESDFEGIPLREEGN
jgi:hypothetical protein